MMLSSSSGMQKMNSSHEFVKGTVIKIAAAMEKINAVMMTIER